MSDCGEIFLSCLEDHIDQDDKERVGETEEEPNLDGFNVRSAGQAGRDGEVDRGQHHHAGGVHREQNLVLIL